ncbi:MAG: PatB family C-S lyase [Anaerolineae bacterium]|nr:PatB family C-S lyase [Anaerolineae bacterium]
MYNFDQVIERRGTDSLKWCTYGDDVLPLWVADMDFRAPEPVIRALHERVEHGVFGYAVPPPALREVIVERLQRLYGWEVSPDHLVFLPGVVTGFNLVCRAIAVPGEGVLVQTPVYPPILRAPADAGLVCEEMELTRQEDGQYEVDFDRFERTITGRTRVFILCNPHNPVGRVFRREELERMAEICLRHHIVICSDEIHCDLVFPGHQHVPIATLSPEVAGHTITLISPSKTFNIPGLKCAVAIVPNADLRRRLKATHADWAHEVNVLGYTAALAAYRDGQPWLEQVLAYLERNLEFLLRYVEEHLPGISMARPEGTYLAWLDCREAGIQGNPARFFLEHARVALSNGAEFGRGGAGFVRLNFGCPHATLVEALERMRAVYQVMKSGDGRL